MVAPDSNGFPLKSWSHQPRFAIAIMLTLFMLAPSSLIIAPPASGDPVIWDNGDMTRSVLWNFTDGADYELYNSTVSNGLVMLESVNGTVGEYSTEDYLLGTRANIDLQNLSDAMVIDNATVAVQTLVLQPGPEGKDNYMDEWFPSWSPPDGSDLALNSQYDPVGTSDKQCRIAMQFDLSSVPSGAIIEDATLSLYEKPSRAQIVEYSIHAFLYSWEEQGVSWRMRDVNHSWVNVGGDFSPEAFSQGTVDGTTGWHTFDLTRLVDLWTRNQMPNYGFVIVPVPAEGDATKTYVDCEITNKPEQRPILTIDYISGEATGVYDSAPIGPGTNSTFTLASWSAGIVSKASDEFDGSNMAPKWSWTMDPALSGGSVNFDRTGWLNVTGSQSTYLPNASAGCNFLHQNITGDFTAETALQAYFSDGAMGAGLMMMNDASSWLAVYRTGTGASTQIVAEASQCGSRTTIASIPSPGTMVNFLRIQRTDTSYQLRASMNGITWTTVGTYTTTYDFGQFVHLGPFVFSGGSALRPVVEFDYVHLLPGSQAAAIDLIARAGNSTSLADPSWQTWSAPLNPNTGAVLARQGKYMQYRATLRTTCDWISPAMSGFECHYERFSENGTVVTSEVSPTSFEIWESITVTQILRAGDVQYFYSVDHGSSWVGLGSGSSFSLSISSPSIMIRAEMTTSDTSVTPTIDTIELVYRITHAFFYVVAPETIEVGLPFDVYIEPKDSFNATASWTGVVTLSAVDSTGLGPASSELTITQATVPAGGQLTVTGIMYYRAETIRILVTGGGAIGCSENLTVTHGPASSIVIDPIVTSIVQNSSTVFNATLQDAHGNVIPESAFTWSADAGLGVLNTTLGPSVNLTTVEIESSGYLTASFGTLTTSIFITVTGLDQPPQISSDIPVQTEPEDFGSWSLDLGPYVSDREDNDSQLRWYTVNESVVKVSGENHTGSMFITFTTVQDLFGENILDLWVVDSDRMSSKATLIVNITAVNDAPTIEPIDPIVVRFADPYQYNLDYYVKDVDTPNELLTLSVDEDSQGYVQISGLWLTFLYPQSLNGTTQTVLLSVSDGEYIASTVVQVTVTDDYVPRTLGALPNQIMNQGDTKLNAFDLDNYFSDPDSSNLYYTNGDTHVRIVIQANHTVDFYAPYDWAGEEYLVFIAKDSRGARAESALLMTVLRVNQPPYISNVPDLVVRGGVQYDFDLTPYIEDSDDDAATLVVTVSDPHVWTMGTLMSMLFPNAMIGTRVTFTITVSDGPLYDSTTINVTVSNDNPPELIAAAPDHTFLEEQPLDYPVLGGINDFFDDPDDDLLTYSAFLSVDNVTLELVDVEGTWSIRFTPEKDWFGLANLTFRATDPYGALAETTVLLTVKNVPDRPELSLPSALAVIEGTRSLLELNDNVTDPDSVAADFRWAIDCDYLDFVTILGGTVVFDFPEDFLDDGEKSRSFTLSISVSDQDNLVDTGQITVTVNAQEVSTKQDSLLWLGILGAAAVAGAVSIYAVSRRKKPFVLHDLMLIHNDGFLIGRYASPHEGEIDENILSGMLTAVLNFVEDSMNAEKEALKTFGFSHYNVVVERGEKCFVAVVYEGDAPSDMNEPLGEFLSTVEKVYRKSMQNWTGDLDTDFAGVEVLIQGFVKDQFKGKQADARVWKMRETKKKVTPKRVSVAIAEPDPPPPEAEEQSGG